MTRQQNANEYLFLWQTLRARGVPPENRLAMIDRLLNQERAMLAQQEHDHDRIDHNLGA